MVRHTVTVTCVIQRLQQIADKAPDAAVGPQRAGNAVTTKAESLVKKLRIAIAATGALLAAPALACSPPAAPPTMPSGKTANKDAMLAKKKEVDHYKRMVEEYLSCEVNPVRVQSAQADLDRVANRFNAEVRAFKAANGG